MTKSLVWGKIITETFLEESGINDRIKLGDSKARILEGIMRTRVAGWTITKQADEFHISVDTVNKYIRELKDLYDETQKYSVILPKRKHSNKEKEFVKMMGIIGENDEIDIDKIYHEMKKQAEKTSITFDLPFIGTITLNEQDIDKMYEHIMMQ